MAARVVNLRTRRKQKARDDRRESVAKGDAPGIARPERERAAAENRRTLERLEAHRLDDPAPDEG
jgi:hypothetical protein